MAKKQVKTAPIVAPAAPAAAAKPRVTASRHSKAKSEKAPEPKIEAAVAAQIVAAPIVAAEVILEEVVIAAPAENPHEAIAKIAYGYYAARGHQHGSQADDWFRAEREYKSRR